MKTLTVQLIFLCTLLVSAAASAGVSVAPAEGYLSPGNNTLDFRVTNQTATPLVFQFSLSPWKGAGVTTAGNEEQLLRTGGLRVSDKRLTVPAHSKTQLTLKLSEEEVAQLALFRLNLNWHPLGSDEATHSLTHSLPVFVTTKGARERVHYRTVHRGNDHFLILENHGQKPAQINAYRWQNGAAIPFYAYAWPGVTRYFKLPKGGEGDLTVNVSGLGWVFSDDALQYVSIY